ncbi:MAG: ATP-dependent Clp protease ATP-binding subunit, partial [Patescibacteria group bacterium]
MHDIIDRFTSHLRNVLTRALCLVVETKATQIEPEHLLWGIATEEGSVGAEILHKGKIDTERLRVLLGAPEHLSAEVRTSQEALPPLSEPSKRVIEKAVLTATVYEHPYVGTEHLIAGLMQVSNKTIATFLKDTNANVEEVRRQLQVILRGTQQFSDVRVTTGDAPLAPWTPEQTEQAGDEPDSPLATLEYFADELTMDINELDPVVGREEEIERIMEVLSRRTKNNPMLIGEPGVGKTAIVEGLARKILEHDVPPTLLNKRIFALDLGALVAGTMYRGEFEGRMKQIIDEVRDNPDVILFIDEAHMMMGAGSASGSMDAANLLKPALARGWIRCIGATTPAEYKKHFEQDGALERRFQPVAVREPSVEETIEILRGLAPTYERHHCVALPDETLIFAARASERYLPANQLPDKAIDLIDEAAAARTVADRSPAHVALKHLTAGLEDIRTKKKVAIDEERYLDASLHHVQESRMEQELFQAQHTQEQRFLGVITVEDIARVIERRTGTRLSLDAHDRTELLQIERALKRVIVGQSDVVRTVATHMRRARMGIRAQNRPLASFLFVGPSGSGKTELAKALADALYQNKRHLIRLDMSEFVERYSLSKLIGSPAGYVGYRDEALLTDRVKKQPHSVVLFDEIEKAHPDIHNLLLQILEEGELCDATGRSISFRHTVVILTSNASANHFANGGIGFGDQAIDAMDVRKRLEDTLGMTQQGIEIQVQNARQQCQQAFVYLHLGRKFHRQIRR